MESREVCGCEEEKSVLLLEAENKGFASGWPGSRLGNVKHRTTEQLHHDSTRSI
jgi:hypothetical protein